MPWRLSSKLSCWRWRMPRGRTSRGSNFIHDVKQDVLCHASTSGVTFEVRWSMRPAPPFHELSCLHDLVAGDSGSFQDGDRPLERSNGEVPLAGRDVGPAELD